MLDWIWANAEKLAALTTAAAFLLVAARVAVETGRFRRTLMLGVHGQLFGSSFNVLNMLLERPSLPEFFYEGREIPENIEPALQQQVRIACEMFSDHFELVCLQMEKIHTEGTWLGWDNYMTNVISQSPALRQHFRETAEWITAPAFRDVVKRGFKRAGEPIPQFGGAD